MAGSTKDSGATNFLENFRVVGVRVTLHRIDESGCPKKTEGWRHPHFIYRFNNRGSLYAVVFEWLIRCLPSSGRHTMLLEVISQPLLCFHPLSFVLAPWQLLNVSPPFSPIQHTSYFRKYIVQSSNHQSARQSPSSCRVSNDCTLMRE